MGTSGIGKGGTVGRHEAASEPEAADEAKATSETEIVSAPVVRGSKPSKAKSGAHAAAPAASPRGGKAEARGSHGVDSALLRQHLEGKLPSGSHGTHGKDAPRASALPSGRDAIHGPAVHAAAKKADPRADERLLAGAKHDQKQLLSDVRSVAKELGLKAEKQGSISRRVAGGLGRADAAGHAVLDADGLRAEGSASASVGVTGRKSASTRGKLGEASGSISGEAQAYAKADGRVSIDRNGLTAKGQAEVGVKVKVEVDGQFRTKGVTIGGERLDVNGQIHGEVEASAYARVDADVAATPNPPRVVVVANAKAFAGVKAAAHGSLGLGDFLKVNASAEAWAGAGAEAGVVAGYDDGKLKLGFNFGAAVGVGAGLSFNIEIDVKKIGKALLGAATGGLLDLDVLLDRGDGSPPLQLAQIEMLFPPQVLHSTAAAGQVEVDRASQTVRYERMKKERDAAEKHVREAILVKAGGA